MDKPRRWGRRVGGYLLVIPTVLATYLVRRALDPFIEGDTPFVVLLFLPVVVMAWTAGIGPALVTAVLAVVVGDKVSMDPDSGAPLAARIVRVATFMGETLLIALMIRARRRGEKKLAASDQRYRTLIDNFPNGAVLLFDRELRYVIAGGKGLSEVGLSSASLIGKRPRDVFGADVAEQVEALYTAALRGPIQVAEVGYAGRQYLTYNLPVRDAADEIVGGMVMTQEITERKRFEEALPCAEDGRDRATRGRGRTRLQQPPHGDSRASRRGRAEAARPRRCSRTSAPSRMLPAGPPSSPASC